MFWRTMRPGMADIFAVVGSVVKQQILAQIALSLAAEQAHVAHGCRVRRDDASADPQAAVHIGAECFHDSPASSCPKYGPGGQSFLRGIPSSADFQIGTARRRATFTRINASSGASFGMSTLSIFKSSRPCTELRAFI